MMFTGAPQFSVGGDAGAVVRSAAALRERGHGYRSVAESLEAVSTQDAWVGRAGDRFRERFDVEPGRWRDAAEAFETAADSLDQYADALQEAKLGAADCRRRWEESEAASAAAKTRFTEQQRASAQHGPATIGSTGFLSAPVVFRDPYESQRLQIEADFSALIARVDEAGNQAATKIKTTESLAPQSRNWLDSLKSSWIGGVITGACEAGVETISFLFDAQYGTLWDWGRVAVGDLTVDELMAKHALTAEQVGDVFRAFSNDPKTAGYQLARALFDVDTFIDDSPRAIGHMVPDVLAAIIGAPAISRLRSLKSVDRVGAAAGLSDVLAQRGGMVARKRELLSWFAERGIDPHDVTRTRIKGTLEELDESGEFDPTTIRQIKQNAGELSELRGSIGRLGERVGMSGAMASVESRGYTVIEGFTVESPGAYRIDLLAYDADAGRIVVAECKGMSGSVDTTPRKLLNGSTAPQDTPAYVQDRMLRDPRVTEFFRDNPDVWQGVKAGTVSIDMDLIRTTAASTSTNPRPLALSPETIDAFDALIDQTPSH